MVRSSVFLSFLLSIGACGSPTLRQNTWTRAIAPGSVLLGRRSHDITGPTITPFGTGVERFPPTSQTPTEVNTVTLYYDADNNWPDCSVKGEIMADNQCISHPMPGWIDANGVVRNDFTISDISNDLSPKTNVEKYKQVRSQVVSLLGTTQTQYNILIPPQYAQQHQANAIGHWAILAAPFTNVPGYSWYVERLDQQPVPRSSSLSTNGQAIGAALFLIAIQSLNLLLHELIYPHDDFDPEHNVDTSFLILDAHFIKYFLTVLRDLVRQGNRFVANAGGIKPTPSLEEIRFAVNSIGTGRIRGAEPGTVFLTRDEWVQKIRQRQLCGSGAAGSDVPPDPNQGPSGSGAGPSEVISTG